ESFSKYKEIRRIDGSKFSVNDFLKEVRKITTDFALGQILHGKSTEGLDEWTRLYLMHRHNFKFSKILAGECLLLAQAYGIDINELFGNYGLLVKEGSNALKLIHYNNRKNKNLGKSHPSGFLPLIDMLHYLIILWENGDIKQVEDYVLKHLLIENKLFWAVTQAILEMSNPNTKERTLIEALISWAKRDKIKQTDLKGKFKDIDKFL
ncbi:unnamed protein product, partial [marine sediment metagenome]